MSEVTIIGFTRFSLVIERSLRWFRATKDLSYEEACFKMFSDEKMKVRFDAFENLCLPTYRKFSQNSSTSFGVVLISYDLPEKWKERLYDLVGNDDAIKVFELERSVKWEEKIKEIISSVAKAKPVFTYRLDDDDALSHDLCEVIQYHGRQANHGDVLSFNDGYQLARYGDDHFRITDRHYPMNAFGIGVYDLKGDAKNIFDLGKHSTIEERNNVIHDQGEARWLRVVHPDNDSRTGVINSENIHAALVRKKIEKKFPHITEKNIKSLPIRDINMNTMKQR